MMTIRQRRRRRRDSVGQIDKKTSVLELSSTDYIQRYLGKFDLIDCMECSICSFHSLLRRFVKLEMRTRSDTGCTDIISIHCYF